MPATKIADVIVPEVFNPYVIERTATLTELALGGIIGRDPQFDELARSGGRVLEMPFWKDLTGADDVLSDSSSLSVNVINSGKDIAILHARGKAWGVNDLAKALSGDDPMRAIGDLVAAYWVRKQQDLLISVLKGVIADNVAANSGDMVKDVAIEAGNSAVAANLIGPEAVIDAATTMGDAANRLSAIAMHSVPFSRLQKQNVIVYQTAANADIRFPTYLGHRVIVDDSLPRVAGSTNGFKYTSYLFGEGAIALGEGMAPVPVETDRDSLGGEDILITRRHFLLHPRGISWTGATNAFPTNAACEAATAWARVYERKNVRIAALVTNG